MGQIAKRYKKDGSLVVYEYDTSDTHRWYKNYKEKHPETYEHVQCQNCNSIVRKQYFKRHSQTKKCKQISDKITQIKTEI